MATVNEIDDIKLLPGEKIVEVRTYQEFKPDKYPSSDSAISRLAKVERKKDIGQGGPVIAAEPIKEHDGIEDFHRYEAVFGRDSLRVAMDLVEESPDLARSTLIYLAARQGLEVSASREEEVGRILHEDRNPNIDPVAKEITKKRGWSWPYYGSVDSTPQFLRLLARYCSKVNNGASILGATFQDKYDRTRTMADAMNLALQWIVGRLDKNKEGLLEYRRAIPGGLENQMWRDSWDAFFHKDGTIANHNLGIAALDVQRVTYEALLDCAEIYTRDLNRSAQSKEFQKRAEIIKTAIIEKFWCSDQGGYFIIGLDRGLDGRYRQLKVKTSDMGHLLHSRLLNDSKFDQMRESIIRQLFSKEMFGINGIMSLANDEYRYRDAAYHNGSVWGQDNYLIAQGLEDNGYYALADFIEQKLLEVITYSHRYVEYSRGGIDPKNRISARTIIVWDEINKCHNTIEQPPQDMQAWTVAAVAAIKFNRRKRGFSRISSNPKIRKLEQELLNSDIISSLA